MATWNAKLRKQTDVEILAGKTDPDVAAVLQSLGLTETESLFRASNRRSKLLKTGHDVAEQSTAVPTPTVDADAIRAIVRDEITSFPPADTTPDGAQKPVYDIDQLMDLVRVEIRGNTTATPDVQTIEIKLPDGATKKIDGAHYLMPRLLKLLGAGMHVYLWGPAGTGKTTAAMQSATALGRESEIDTMDPSTFRSMVQGYRTPTGDPIDTAFTRCWENGRQYIADELDNAPGHVQTLFNSALANGHAPLGWGSVKQKTGFGFVGTGNTPGRPTRAFPDRRPMSQAFADRMYFFFFPLDEAIECRKCGLPVPKPPKRIETTCTPKQWGEWVQSVRRYCKTNAPTVQVTPRATFTGLTALAVGETPEEVADGLVFRGCDDELRSKILAACPLPSGDSKPDTTDTTTAKPSGRVRIHDTKFNDHEARAVLKSYSAKWNKKGKFWTATNLPKSAIAKLESRGCRVEVL